jgi:hypothetical protein
MKYLLIVALCILAFNIVGMQEEKKDKKYEVCKKLWPKDEDITTIVDAFFLPQEKNKVVIAYQTGCLKIFDIEKKTFEEDNYCYIKDLRSDAGKTLQHAFYDNNSLWMITSPYVLHEHDEGPKVAIKQQIFNFKKEDENHLWKNLPGSFDLFNFVFSDIDIENRLLVASSTISDVFLLLRIPQEEDFLVTTLYPQQSGQDVGACVFDKRKKLCAMAVRYNKNVSPYSSGKTFVLSDLISKIKYDTKLVLIRNSDRKELWEKNTRCKTLDDDIQSVAFSKDGLRLVCLTPKQVVQYNCDNGEKIGQCFIPCGEDCFFTSIRCTNDSIVVFNKKKNKAGYFDLIKNELIKITKIPEKFMTHKTVRYNEDKSMKVKVCNNSLIISQKK